ncbi:MAG: hypothetical protein HZA06_00880 [Nitrospirae bacterium]|nr:hypothetical protein [Nitrospirota bacterium]
MVATEYRIMVATEYRIYEDNGILRDALDKTISSLKLDMDNVIVINIAYSEGRGSDTLYSGMKYIVNLRGEKKDNSPVIFYGFENLESLKKKPDASILNSPAVEYIKIPFEIGELEDKIKRLSGDGEVEDGLDKQTKKQAALSKLGVFEHDVLNAIRTVQIAYRLKRSGTEEIQRRNWDSVKKSFFEEKEKIGEIVKQFDSSNSLKESFPKKDIVRIRQILKSSENKYKTLIKSLNASPKNSNSVIISTAEAIEGLLEEVVRILRGIK